LSLPNVISDTLEGDDEGLISDFYGWRATSYVALLTRLHPDRIFLAPGEPNVEPDLRSLSAFLDEYPRGVVVLVTGSRFSDMVGKTLAGEAKAWRYGVGLQPVYSVEWPEPGKDPKNPSLEIFRYQVEGR
jgi:hypothetical protein